MDAEELVRRFSLERVSSSPSIFDANKLEWVSSHHMKSLSAEALVEGIRPFLEAAGVVPGNTEFMARAVSSLKVAAKKLPDLASKVAIFLEEPGAPDEDLAGKMRSESGRLAMGLFRDAVAGLERTDAGSVRQALAAVLETSGLKKGQVFMPLRAALTGRKSGPEIPLIVEVLGRQRTLDLLDAATESEADR
jgi:glutamyl/glutaminyl-tRNA synthetase